MELFDSQGGVCLYTATALTPTSLDDYVIDHIVPRAHGGPDSILNYALTTREANDEKADRTPYEWLASTPGWDAYVERIRKRLAQLRNKKVQLLVSPKAAELAEKYTALAETAWISKLAQTIIGLRFGWPGGIQNGERKVIVVSGGLTGRIRRKYKLNALLNPDASSEEEAEKKNRDDDRHHALDAMVISYLPTWARNSRFSEFFRFPDGVHQEFFGKHIAEVIPQRICFEKAALAETIYGARQDLGKKVIVQRVRLVDLAYKSIGPGKTSYDVDYGTKQAKKVRDPSIQQRLLEFLRNGPNEAQWVEFCAAIRVARQGRSDGSRVRLISRTVGDPSEYRDLSKDRTGAYRKALKAHKGQIVYLTAKGRPRVQPVYAFESEARVMAELRASRDMSSLVGFFQSGCLVRLGNRVENPKTPLAAGTYTLGSIWADGRVRLKDQAGNQSLPISLEELLAAGFNRV